MRKLKKEELEFIQRLNPKGFVVGSDQRRMVDILQRIAGLADAPVKTKAKPN